MSTNIGSTLVSEGKRSTLSLILLIGNFLSIIFSIVYFGLSWYIAVALKKQITFLKNYYQPAAIPVSIAITSGVMLLTSLLGIKAAIGSRFDDDDEEVNVNSAGNFMLVYWICALVVCGLIFATAIVCFVEIYELEEALGKGLKNAMHSYRTDGALKAEIDFLQMDYLCCGISSYKDWFNISWIDLQYLDINDKEIKRRIKDGYYYGEDTPFSCCKPKMSRPCVDTRIFDNKYHSNYNKDTDITLNKIGCRDAIVKFLGHAIFRSVGLFILLCLLVWITMTISARYLQTSIKSISKGNEPFGWLIGISMKKKVANQQDSNE